MREPYGENHSEATRIARFMGLEGWKTIDDVGLVDHVRNGLPSHTATTIFDKIDPDGRFVRVTDVIPKSTLHRRKNQPLTKEQSDRILALSRVFAEALRIYRDDMERAVEFLIRRHPLLKSRRPIEVATVSIAGADLVLKVLSQADAGVAA